MAFVAYVWTIRHELAEAFSNLSAATLAGLSGLLLAHWLLRVWRDRFLYSALGYRPRAMAIFWLNTLQLSLNYLPLKAGTLWSSEASRSKLGVPFRDFALVLGQQYLLIVFASSLLAVAALCFFADASLPGRVPTAVVLAAVAATCCALLSWDGFVRFLPGPIARRIEGGARKFALFRSSPRLGACALVLTLAICLVAGLRMVLVYRVLAIDLGLPGALVISASMQLSAMVSITPGGIAVVESMVALSSVVVGHTAENGVVAATLDRAVTLALAIFLAALLIPFEWRRREPAGATLSPPGSTGGS